MAACAFISLQNLLSSMAVADREALLTSRSVDEASEVSDEFETMAYEKRSRQAVSSEAYGEWNRKEDFVPPVFPKSDEERDHISELLSSSFLFASLDPSDLCVLIDAFERLTVEPCSTVIRQGDLGDFLCLVESGELACFQDSESGRKQVGVCRRGDVFGELSLLYSAPRAATVESVSACTLWRLDSKTFVSIVREGAAKKRERYEHFLNQVPLLASVGSFELSQIADALVPQNFMAHETVVTEGEGGDTFFLIESGSAEAWKQNELVFTYSQPGEFFGELALLKQEPRAATVKAGANGCRVLALDRNSFNRLLGDLEALTLRQYS